MSWFSRLVNGLRAGRMTDELDEELQFHVESRARELIAGGAAPADALREARRRLGNAGAIRERSRDIKLLPAVDAFFRDARFGLRMLRKDAVISVAAIASLALAIGACTAAFALVDALILRPLPVRDPGRLVSLAIVEGDTGRDRLSFNYPLFLRMRDAVDGRLELASFSSQNRRVAVFDAQGDDERVYAQFVSGNAFNLLGVTPSLGRVLVPSDDVLGHPRHVAVLSHSFWVRRFGGDRAVIGRSFTVAREPYEIVGVAREGFTGVEPGIRTDFWMPITSTSTPESLASPGWHWFKVLGRLTNGHTAEDTQATLQAVLTTFRKERVAQQRSGGSTRAQQDRYVAAPLFVRSASNGISELRADFERPLWILTVVVALVLLIACSNLANLMLARGAARDREMALRLSIGAGRGRLIQQMLIEGSAIALVAAVAGALFARIAAPTIVALLAPSDTPAYLDLRFDVRLLAVAAGLGAVATLLFGLVPAVRASGTSPIEALKVSGSRHSASAAVLRPLVAAQIAFSLTVLFVAGLLLTSFHRLANVNTGFEADGLALIDVELVDPDDPAKGGDASLALLERVRELPGVREASVSGWALLNGGGWSGSVRVGSQPPDGTEVYFLEVSPGFVGTMKIALRQGRDLARQDFDPASPSVLVNETFARKYFPGPSAIGRRFEGPGRGSELEPERRMTQEIVGVVGDAKYIDLREVTPPTVYMPLRPRRSATLQVRSAMNPDALAAAVNTVARRLTPKMKVTSTTLQATLVDNTMLKERLMALLSGFFALVTLTLAGVGLYGVLSYSVVQQTREIGIRIALGAAQRAIVIGVLRGVGVFVALGMAVGLGAGAWLSQFVTKLLYEVSPADTASLIVPLGALLVVAALAALLPARRAARVDPIVALREE